MKKIKIKYNMLLFFLMLFILGILLICFSVPNGQTQGERYLLYHSTQITADSGSFPVIVDGYIRMHQLIGGLIALFGIIGFFIRFVILKIEEGRSEQ